MGSMNFFAKRLPLVLAGVMCLAPAFSQTEEELDKWMKAVGKTAGALRKANEANDAEALKAGGKTMVDLFGQAETFWAKHKMTDAVEMNKKTVAGAKALADGTGNLQGLMSTCKGCHDKYREKLEDGSYKLKMSH
jgi:cytochrome c556